MKTIVIVFSLFISLACMAQTSVQFTYDQTGNRIQRKVITLKSGQVTDSVNSDTQQAINPEVFTDVLGQSNLAIYPNPTRGALKVKFTNVNEKQNITIQVYDVNGRLVVNKTKATAESDINLYSAPNGTYIMKISSGSESTTWKIVKE